MRQIKRTHFKKDLKRLTICNMSSEYKQTALCRLGPLVLMTAHNKSVFS